jgi:hypothetical protein
MSWPEVRVEARLDADGTLHVRERQVILFDGAWNGGERTFRVGRGQRLHFERLLRETDDGRMVELRRGDLEQVDRWDFTDRRTLRWRSRARDDPPFASSTVVYVLEYTLAGVLVRSGESGRLLDHDFAFPDRSWPIGAILVRIVFDPAWQAAEAGPLHLDGGPLPPGAGFVARVPLRWSGAGEPPSAAGDGLPAARRAALAAVLVALFAAAASALLGHARSRGQLTPPVDATAHYRDRGYDPAEKIRDALKRAVGRLAPEGPAVRRGVWLLAGALLLAGAVVGATGGEDPPLVLTVHAVLWPLLLVAAMASRLRRRVTGFAPLALAIAALLAAWAAFVIWLSAGGLSADPAWILAHACFWAAGLALALALGRTPLGPEEMAVRKRLAASRAHLACELRREEPRLEDSWLPYLLAFGLGPDVDRWFRAHGAPGDAAGAVGPAVDAGGSGAASGSLDPSPRWTGGGGAFSGGGATGTWAALGGIAASIPSPSSGSSDSGGNGGSSSGGGGAGGW